MIKRLRLFLLHPKEKEWKDNSAVRYWKCTITTKFTGGLIGLSSQVISVTHA